MDFFYDGQIRRYVTQFMRIFIGFKYKDGNGNFTHIPVMYGDMSRQVASIIKENSENKLPNVPRISCYINGLELDSRRLGDATFVSKVNIRERSYDVVNGARQYNEDQGANYTVERLMPTPFKLSMRADIWSSNTDQKLQILEQILVLFNPSLEIQTTDNYLDWTSLSVVYLNGTNFTTRSIPAGVESEIDICTLDFEIPIWITPPAKVKKLGVVRAIIANIFTEAGDVTNLQDLIYENGNVVSRIAPTDYGIVVLNANNGVDFDYQVTLVGNDNVVIDNDNTDVPTKLGADPDWQYVLEKYGSYQAGVSKMFLLQPNGNEVVGDIYINEADPKILILKVDRDTLQNNTLIVSENFPSGSGTITAIVNPLTFNPIAHWNGLENIPLGTRYLLLETIGSINNVDGPEGWKGSDGSTQTSYQLDENDIVEWNGTKWVSIFDSSSIETITYVRNLRTGVQYKWDGTQWLKSFEGEYSPGYWRLDLNP